MRVRLLRTGERLRLRVSAGDAVRCCAGSVRVLPGAGAQSRTLVAGEEMTFEAAGTALLTAQEGMRGEWLEDTGMVLVCLPALPG